VRRHCGDHPHHGVMLALRYTALLAQRDREPFTTESG
jgi:hypothetical protein